MQIVKIPEISDSPAIDISINTIDIGKQALVFCNTRKSAEATAEKISKIIKTSSEGLEELKNQILKVLSSPTKQCRRLAMCVSKGIAFHHAGLAPKQRDIIEENFKKGIIKIICSTPTLAMGINLPAYRSIIKDLKRYGGRWGMQYIPTLEYHQMAGRAGRPDFGDTTGQAICISSSESETEEILERFITAPPEKIYSKLAAEPALRTYSLSLIATGFCKSREDLMDFFSKTFYASQYGDMEKIEYILEKIIRLLEEWEFIKTYSKSEETIENDFVSADTIIQHKSFQKLEATRLGQRVAELYLDPYTAHEIIISIRRSSKTMTNEFSYISLACSTLELRPLTSVRTKEVEEIEAILSEKSSFLLILEPSIYEPEYDEFLKAIKLSLALESWMDESSEDDLLEKFNLTPGELHNKKNLCDWILYATEELSSLLAFQDQIKVIKKTRFRLDKGVREELIPLVRIKNIGRVRARKMFRNGIKDVGDLKKTDLNKLIQLVGNKTAVYLKEQVGENVQKKVSDKKRKGQLGLGKFDDD